jgi:uncharacterized membrane protein
MVRPDRFLTDDDRKRVLDAVKDAESRTAGEIRVLIVGRSARHAWVPALIVGAATGGGTYAALNASAWGWAGPAEAIAAASVGAAAAFAGWWFIPRGRRAKKRSVWARAGREFARLGIGKTAGATGVLVMLSLWEREAVVLADKAINDKAAPDTWAAQVKILLDGVKAGRPGEGIAASVKEIGAILARHFPRRPDDVNELPDDLETRK